MAVDTAPDSSTILDDITTAAPPGTILPPKNVRAIIEKAAGYIARNGPSFLEHLIANNTRDGKLACLWPEDAYHAYYQWRLSEIKAGKGNLISAGREGEQGQAQTGVSGKGREERKPDKPDEFVFSARMPNISAQDLEIVKLTALFAAKNGRSWMTALSQREAGNFQFDFLRPQHSLYQFFSRLVDQYTDLIQGDSVDGGRPQKKRITELEANVFDRFRVLERAKKRAEWVKWQETQKVEKEEQDEKEKVAYAQIDWHDFVVVETVVFDERDEQAELPAPTTKNDLQSASLEQKAAMSIAPNRRIEEAMPTFDDYDTFYGSNQQQQQQQQMPPPQLPYTPQPVATAWRPPPGQDDDAGRLAEVRADRDRARAAQEAARHAPPSVKVRDSTTFASRVQKGKAGALPPNTSICPNCHQPIPNNEMERHMKIELLDPQWRDQNRINQHRSSTTNLSTQDVANNLKRLASQRSDVFDPVTGASVDVDEAEAIRRRRAELGGYDGVSGVPSPAALGGMGLQQQTMEAMQQQGQVGQQGHVGQTRDVQEQIRQLHQRYKG